MEMERLTETYEVQMVVRRTVLQTARNYLILSKIFCPIVKIGGDKIDNVIRKISQFWAAKDTGRFEVNGNRYRLKSSGRGFRIVAV